MLKRSILFSIFTIFIAFTASAQSGSVSNPTGLTGQNENRAIITAVPFLMIAPDARASAMGDTGAATSADANSSYWNPSKLAYAPDKFGVSLAYNPWLQKIVDDMSLSYLSGYYRINDRQVVGMSMRYFDLGSIQFTDDSGNAIGNSRPNELSLDATFAMKLSQRFSMGVTGRYIYSNLQGAINNASQGTTDSKAANTFAFDLSAYWQNPDLAIAGYKTTLGLGANISNIGQKLSYMNNNVEDFIPSNLRLGTALTTELDPYNKLTFALDFNKLLVPSPEEGGTTPPDKSLFSGIFGSFSDAPNGFSEELQEIGISSGLEYWYNDMLAVRAGYFYENPNKGDRQYMTFGVGIRYQLFGFDFSYLLSNERNHPLADTIRFTIMLNFNKGEGNNGGSSGSGGNNMLDDDI